jgi:hypothetical protein
VSYTREPSSAKKSRDTWRPIGGRSELGAGTDQQAVSNPRGINGATVDPRRLNTTGESQRSSERGALVSYFRDIADIPTLAKEEEVLLAKEIEVATLAFRDGMMKVSWTAREAVRIWRSSEEFHPRSARIGRSRSPGGPACPSRSPRRSTPSIAPTSRTSSNRCFAAPAWSSSVR